MFYGRFIQSKQVDKVAPFHDPLKTLKTLKLTDCVIKKDVTTMPLLIYYHELYMLISALILET